VVTPKTEPASPPGTKHQLQGHLSFRRRPAMYLRTPKKEPKPELEAPLKWEQEYVPTHGQLRAAGEPED
jgi:hypothetical protein